MTVYIDDQYRCYTQAGDGLAAVEHTFFDGKCASLIECYRYVPNGETWVGNDGTVFKGEMITPHTDITAALQIQKEYEEMEANASDYVAAYNEGVASVWA